MAKNKTTDTSKDPISDKTEEKAAKVELESKLIDLVREQTFLYDMSTSKYKCTISRDSAFKDIATRLGMTLKESKKMWTELRNQFRSFQTKLSQRSGSEAKKRPFFRHEDAMQFLKDYMETESTFSNVNDSESGIDQTLDDSGILIVDVTGNEPFPSSNGLGCDDSSTDSKLVPNHSKKNEYRSHQKYGGKRKMDSFDESLLQMLKSKDCDDTFGKMVAGKLRILRNADPKLAIDTEFKINSVLHDAEMKI